MQKSEETKTQSQSSKDEETLEKEEIDDLEREADGLDERIEKHRKRLKAIIQRMAELLEKKFIREGKPDEVKTICSTICKRFPEKKNIRSTAAKNLDKKYKRGYYSKEYENVAKATFSLDPESEEGKIQHKEDMEAFDRIKNLPKELNPNEDFDEIRRNCDIAYNYIQKADKLAEDTGKDLLPASKRYGASKYLQKKFEPEEKDDDKISLEDLPLPKDKTILRLREILHNKLLRRGELNRLLDQQIMERNYVSDDDLKVLEDLIFGAEIENRIIELIVSDRNSVDFQQGIRITMDHLGIDKSYLDSNNKNNKLSDDHGFHIDLKTGKIKRNGRPVEKYQIMDSLGVYFETDYNTGELSRKWGDSLTVKNFNLSDLIVRKNLLLNALCRNHRDGKRKAIRTRKAKGHLTKSESAFGKGSKRKDD
jgi:hypothetical protein